MNRGPSYIELLIYVLTLVGAGACGAFAVLLTIGMYVEPHNMTAENIAWAVAAVVAMGAFWAVNDALSD